MDCGLKTHFWKENSLVYKCMKCTKKMFYSIAANPDDNLCNNGQNVGSIQKDTSFRPGKLNNKTF